MARGAHVALEGTEGAAETEGHPAVKPRGASDLPSPDRGEFSDVGREGGLMPGAALWLWLAVALVFWVIALEVLL
jgi:hypothetical protein